jgi:hypothetical protein
MVKAWDLLNDKYEGYFISYYSYAAHTLNLLLGDILKLNTISNIFNSVKSLIKCIKKPQGLTATLSKVQKQEGVTESLKLPAVTRWAFFKICLDSFIANKQPIKALAIYDTGCKLLDKESIKEILNETFWETSQILSILLIPIKDWIIYLESDIPRISKVPEAFYEIKQHCLKQLNIPLLQLEGNLILEAIDHRCHMALTPLYFLADMLDPSLKGKNLTAEQKTDAFQLLEHLSIRFNCRLLKTSQITGLQKVIGIYHLFRKHQLQVL